MSIHQKHITEKFYMGGRITQQEYINIVCPYVISYYFNNEVSLTEITKIMLQFGSNFNFGSGSNTRLYGNDMMTKNFLMPLIKKIDEFGLIENNTNIQDIRLEKRIEELERENRELREDLVIIDDEEIEI